MPLDGNLTISLDNISIVSNFTEFPEFLINVSHYMYEDLLFFILFIALWAIGFLILQSKQDQILNNAFISSGVMSLIVMVARAIQYTRAGTPLYLLTDYHMWIFAIITICLGGLLWATKEKGA